MCAASPAGETTEARRPSAPSVSVVRSPPGATIAVGAPLAVAQDLRQLAVGAAHRREPAGRVVDERVDRLLARAVDGPHVPPLGVEHVHQVADRVER